MRLIHRVILFTVLIGTVVSCKPTRHIQDGQHLVTRSVIHINENKVHEFELDESDIKGIIKQSPNRRILGLVPFHLGIWNFAETHRKEKKFNQYLRSTVGEAPVIYEPLLLEKSEDQILRHLHNSGYFNARVRTYALLDHNTAELHYYIHSGPAYRLRRISMAFEDTALIREFNTKKLDLKLYPGKRFDTEDLDNERKLISEELKNRGYYSFEKIHVIFDVDTNLEGERFNISIRLRNLRQSGNIDGRDTIIEKSHEKHYINKVIVNENFNLAQTSEFGLDSLFYRSYLFLHFGKPYVRPLRLSRNISVNPGDMYNLDKTRYTYQRISALNNFKFIDLKFEPSDIESEENHLDMIINLSKAPRHALTFETTGTNRSGNLGINAGINYKNRNLFRGAEQLDWKIYGGLESQRTNSTTSDQQNEVIEKTKIFNTFEFGTQVSLTIPDFLLRNRSSELSWIKEPKTIISASTDRQVRPQYNRTLLNTSYSWNMRLFKQDLLVYTPIDLSVIDLQKSKEFESQLLATNNSLLINSYSNHIIPAGRISFSNTTIDLNNSLKNYHYYKINVETAGNLLRAVSKTLSIPYDASSDSYTIDGIAFSQYAKVDFDFAQYVNLTRTSKMVYRFFGGLGAPFQNLNTLPFERSFFAGGSNGIRGWRARALGPGSLSDTATFGIDQVGETHLELNIEYRFEIIEQVEGALFSDIGNIWILNYDPQRIGANFELNRFYKELAISPGAGVRLNFDFFILRLDGGFQLHNPSLASGERWFFQPKTKTQNMWLEAYNNRASNDLPRNEDWTKSYRPGFTFNLAINYPF